ncbi:hypothetical protein N431DRAFT_237796 [Stipitochalara longipes BDJ]|nr:hypothetical protein N431DRAFT_237796 [Stipitochalara longipes BDJ]
MSPCTYFKSPSFSKDPQHITITNILGPASRCSGVFLVSLLYSITLYTCCESYIRSCPLGFHTTIVYCCILRTPIMVFGGRTRVAIEGPNSQSAASMGDKLGVFIPPPGLVSIPSHSAHKGEAHGDEPPFTENTETIISSAPPVLGVEVLTETTEDASMPNLSLSSSSLSHGFPRSILSPAAAQPESDKKPVSAPLVPPKVPPRPKKGYLHRTPTGRLTEIGPSPLCQETTKILLGEAEEKEGNRVIQTRHRIFKTYPRSFLGMEVGSEQDIPTLDQKEEGTNLSAKSAGNEMRYVGYKMHYRDPRIFLRRESGSKQYNSTSDQKDADTGLNVVSKENRLDYAGYTGCKIFNTDPRTFLAIESAYQQDNCNSEQKASEYSFDVELPPDEASVYSSEEDDKISIGSEYPDVSEAPIRNLSRRRLFPVSSSIRPFELCLTAIEPEAYDFEVVKQSPVNEEFLARCQKPTITVPKRPQPLFNPSLEQEVNINSEWAERLNTPSWHDLARIEFKNRRGRLWNMANKNLERLYLHATELKESEFLELVSCKMDEVQTWLDEHGPRLIKRSMAKRIKACETLRHAGIQPCEISEEVMDIFELMNEREQTEFIRKYQKLFALVKSSQERLHLTPSEMEHFSRLPLAGKYRFIDMYKSKREERERRIRRDTTIFTAKLRRTSRASDEMPFPDCSSPQSLRELNSSIPGTSPKRGSFDDHQKQRRLTAFTGDGGTRDQKLDKINATDEKTQSKHVSGLVVYYNDGLDSKGCNITVREVSASDGEQSTVSPTDTILTVPDTGAEHQEIKEAAGIKIPKHEVVDNRFQDCEFATSLLSTELGSENEHKENVETEEDDMPEAIWPEYVLKRSPRKDWLGVHPGAETR